MNIKYIITSTIGFIGLAFFFFLLYLGMIAWWHLILLMIGHGIFLVFFYNVDRVGKMIVESKLLRVFVEIREELKEARKEIVPKQQDVHISAKDKIRFGDIERPNVIKFKDVINKIEVLVNKAEKQLSGTISGKSNFHGNITVTKKKK